jgi:hypothetical protein
MLTQKEFNKFVENYNADYLYLLTRASSGFYECLITSARVLKDLYTMICKIHEVTSLEFEIVPYPLTFRASDETLAQFGFSRDQIENIRGFLQFVKRTQGKEVEECLEEDMPARCIRK